MARATAGGESASNKEDRIVDVAFGLFAARGFDGVSMSDIAEGARLTKATLYHYFPGKDAIFAAILKHQSFNADRVRAMFHASGQPLQEQLVDVAVRYLTVLSEPPRITQIVLRSNGDSPGILKVKQMLVRHLAERGNGHPRSFGGRAWVRGGARTGCGSGDRVLSFLDKSLAG